MENLIKENSELLDMKNALNIVKNDLINQVDELNSENMILRDENMSRQMVSEKMQEQIAKLEEEVKTMKQKLMEKENEQEEVCEIKNCMNKPTCFRKMFRWQCVNDSLVPKCNVCSWIVMRTKRSLWNSKSRLSGPKCNEPRKCSNNNKTLIKRNPVEYGNC